MTWDEPPEPEDETATFTVSCNVDITIVVTADVNASETKLAELVEEYLNADGMIYRANINGTPEIEDRTVD